MGGGGANARLPAHLLEKHVASDARFVALSAFSLLTVINGYAWLLFEPIETAIQVAYAPDAQPTTTALLGSWQPLVYLLLFMPMTKLLLRHNGLTLAMRLGITAEVVGVSCKIASLTPYFRGTTASLMLLHLGQILSAVSSPVAIGAPSQMSAEWFSPAERVRATAVGVLSNNVGNAAVYLFVPIIVKGLGGGSNGVFMIIVIEAVLAVIAAVLIYYAMPLYDDIEWTVENVDHLPPVEEGSPNSNVTSQMTSPDLRAVSFGSPHNNSFHRDSDEESLEAATEKSHHMSEQMRRFCTNYSAATLFCVYAWTSGAFIAWTALFDHLLLALHLPFSEQFVGSLSFASTLGYIIGGLGSSYAADTYFPRHMKTIIILCCVANLGVTTLYANSLPVRQGRLAIEAAEEAIALTGALGKNITDIAMLGDTAVRLVKEPDRDTQLDGSAAVQIAELGFTFVRPGSLRLPFTLSGHRQLWWPADMPKVGPAWKDVKMERKRAVHDARAIALEADRALADATPSPQLLLTLSFLGGFFNGGSAPLFYELVAEVTYPLVSEAVSGNIMSVGENAGALIMFQVVARFVADASINMVFAIGMALSTVAAITVRARYYRAEAFARGVDVSRAARTELRLERNSSRRGERSSLLLRKSKSTVSSGTPTPAFNSTHGGATTVDGCAPLSGHMGATDAGHYTSYGTADEVDE